MSSHLFWLLSSSWSVSSLSPKSGPRKTKPSTFQVRAKSPVAFVSKATNAHQVRPLQSSRVHQQETRKILYHGRAVKCNRSAQLIGVKTLLYLILAVATILLAVMLLSRIYNAVLGGDPTSQDAKLLAATINQMIDDERPYIQVPLLLRMNDARIVGFESNQKYIEVPGNKCTEQEMSSIANSFASGAALGALVGPGGAVVGGITNAVQTSNDFKAGADSITIQNTRCNTKACACSSSDDSVNECFTLNTPRDTQLRLRSNYQGYASCLGSEGGLDTPFLPDAIQGEYTRFVIDKNAVKYLTIVDIREKDTTSTTVKRKTATAIIPVIIEKITQGDKTGPRTITIVISPDSDRIRGRNYYFATCAKGSEEGCEDQTSASSFDGKTYCAPSLTTGLCTRQDMQQCNLFCGTVQEPCICPGATPDERGNHVATYGFCAKSPQGHFPVNCEVVEKCEDYCKQDGAEACTGQELTACQFDSCRVTIGGRMCTVTTNTGNFNAVLSMAGLTTIDEQCKEIGSGSSLTPQARLQC